MGIRAAIRRMGVTLVLAQMVPAIKQIGFEGRRACDQAWGEGPRFDPSWSPNSGARSFWGGS